MQNKYLAIKTMGLEIGKGLTEIIEDLIGGLIAEGENQDDDDVEVLRRRIPMALRVLKERIFRLNFNLEDKEMLEDLRRMIHIFILRKRTEEEEPESEPLEDNQNMDADGGGDPQSTSIVKSSQIKEYER